MQDLLEKLTNFLSAERLVDVFAGLVVFAIGVFVARFARGLFRRLVGPRLSPQHSLVVEKAIYYVLNAVAVLTALHASGADPSVLLGAAGILTLALGFASQTTVSNLISGLFLVGEQMFKIGDVVRVGDKTGYVDSIDLLSVKLRTFDNVLVRLPNETLLKSEITNVTRYPVRRLDLTIGVAYKEDVRRVGEILNRVAEENPYCLDEPKPAFWFLAYGDSSVQLRFTVWFAQENFWEANSRIQQEIYEALTREGVEIPFPHRTLYPGSVTEPFPIRVVNHDL